MHPTEPKNAFLVMRGNGWSLGRISKQLSVPKSTLFHWESEPVTRRTINYIKALQLEKLQEKYIPSAEEELTRLSICLARLEDALDKQNFDQMRPEFLLRASLHVRSRLHKLRSDVQPSRTLADGEIPPNPLPGCLSRSETEISHDDEAKSLEAAENILPSTAEKVDDENGTTSHENTISFRSNHSEPATSNDQNGTIVRFSEPESTFPPASISADAPSSDPASSPSTPCEVSHNEPAQAETISTESPAFGRERYGDLAIPLSKIPARLEEIALAVGVQSSRAATPPPCHPKPSRPLASPPQKPCAPAAKPRH